MSLLAFGFVALFVHLTIFNCGGSLGTVLDSLAIIRFLHACRMYSVDLAERIPLGFF